MVLINDSRMCKVKVKVTRDGHVRKNAGVSFRPFCYENKANLIYENNTSDIHCNTPLKTYNMIATTAFPWQQSENCKFRAAVKVALLLGYMSDVGFLQKYSLHNDMQPVN